MHSAVLQGPVDFAGFRNAARDLLRRGIAPEHVTWSASSPARDLFEDETAPTCASSAQFRVPAAFLHLAQSVALHSAADRFALLYRILWRLRTEPRLLQVSLDTDVARAQLMAKSVHRDIHKMHAFVRFRRVPGAEPRAFVAWFEPQHHIVEAAAPFFVRRFTNTPWAIITPQRRAVWNLEELSFGPGGRRSEVPADDATEDLWRSYYASIFNPARLKVNAMRGHMPRKYWRNLPESPLIPGLIAQSRQRTHTMIEQSVTAPARRHERVGRRAPAPGATEPLTLAGQARTCRGCPLWQHATGVVFGEGRSDARVMLVGEQPGDQEDLQGRPFMGPAGQLLDRALAAAGLERSHLYVTNAVKHFKFEPRGKRRLHKTPGQLEIDACHQWLEREIDMVRPALIVALGATAARSLLGKAIAVQDHRGRIAPGDQAAGRPALLITTHPAALLRLPQTERADAFDRLVNDLRLAAPYGLSRSMEATVMASTAERITGSGVILNSGE